MFETALPDLNGKSILVTGGTGSFGKAFIRRVLKDWQPKRLII
ncbi:polysaccharide biosynthesis protein, partial [Dongia sp.]